MSNDTTSVEILKQEVTPVIQQAASITVATPEAYKGAADFLKAVKAAQKKVVDFFGPMKKATHDAWKKVTATETETLKPLQDAEATVKTKMLEYSRIEEEKRMAEQRRLQAEADEAARRERERLEKKAAQYKTEEKRQAALEQAAAVVAPVIEVASVKPVVVGQSIRKTWKARVIDVAQVPREWMVVNQQALDAFARSTKGAVKIAGVEMYEESTLASASK